MGQHRYRNGFQVTLHWDLISQPLGWKKPRTVFVNSMSDLFHDDVPVEFIHRVFATIERCPQYLFQILTKRSKRLREIYHLFPWPQNVWMGVTVEDKAATGRLSDLASVPAHVRFLSCEPLVGLLGDLPLEGIHWVIVGGESGPGARPMRTDWVEDVFRQCGEQNIPFFFKQWGGVCKHVTGRIFRGKIYDDLPASAHKHAAALSPTPA